MSKEVEAKFFESQPIEFELYKKIKQFINSLGSVEIKTTKSQISFSNRRQFVWVWFPMPWDERRSKDSIVLSFSLGKKITNPQIAQVIEPYPGRFMHHVVVEKQSDINAEVEKWLKEAYKFAR